MQTYRLKNIIILLLVLVNIFLLILLGNHWVAQRSAYKTSVDQLSTLFASEGISLDPSVVPDASAPPPLTLSRSVENDRSLAQAVLGQDLTVSDEGGGIYLYESDSGTARFRTNGAFDITVYLPPEESPEALCQRICETFGYGTPAGDLTEGTGTYTAPLLFGETEVINCSISFSFTDYALISISGYLLPDGSSSQSAGSSMSAITALTLFLQSRSDSDSISVSNQILSVSAGYLLESTPAAPLSLTPVWHITTDTYEYYVNCSTRDVVQM